MEEKRISSATKTLQFTLPSEKMPPFQQGIHYVTHPESGQNVPSDEAPICVECGDGITAHDPGICGCCYSTKYEKPAASAEPVAWMIRYAASSDFDRIVYHGHNAVADYRDIDPGATSVPLYAAPVAAQASYSNSSNSSGAGGHDPQSGPWYPWLERRYGVELALQIIRDTIDAARQQRGGGGTPP